MDTSLIELPGRRTRRRHPVDFKQGVIQACMQPGVSIAAIAVANGLNTNMVRKWVIDAEARQGRAAIPSSRPSQTSAMTKPPEKTTPGFLPLATAVVEPAPISIEINRAGTAIKVSWPSSSAAECAVWLRELLR